MKDAIVIGAGIIGATVAKTLSNNGLAVMLVDDGRPLSGTRPSGGHLKPSWFGRLLKVEYEPAMELLDSVWGLVEEEYSIYRSDGIVKSTETVYRVDTDKVIATPKTVATVTNLRMLDNFPIVELKSKDGVTEERCRKLVICTGSWVGELLPQMKVVGKQGISFRVKPSNCPISPFIVPWAPYKQVVAHQQNQEEVWVGDGTTILVKNWTVNHSLASRKRAVDVVSAVTEGSCTVTRQILGIRPYAIEADKESLEPCLFRQIGPRAFVATGAGKGGTIAAGWVARRILDATAS